MLYQVTKMYPPRTLHIEVEAEDEDEAIKIAQEYDDDEWGENPNDEFLDADYVAEEIG